MPNYNAGKIYSIRSHQTDKIYIGSTTVSLALRLGEHRRMYKRWLADNSKTHFSSFEILKHPDHYIELLELYPCSSKSELERREGELIRANNCVNKIVVGRTKAEYYQDNKEAIAQQVKQYYQATRDTQLQYRKQHYQANKDQYKQYASKKIRCDFCNIHFRRDSKAAHIKTTKHETNFKASWLKEFGEPYTGEITLECY